LKAYRFAEGKLTGGKSILLEVLGDTTPLTGGMVALAPLLLLRLLKENVAVDAMELMELRLVNLRSFVLATAKPLMSGFEANGSGITISISRSCLGALPGIRLPTSLPTRDRGKEPVEYERGIISSSNGIGAGWGKADIGNPRRCRTIRVYESDR
jgi:hypothetical protein